MQPTITFRPAGIIQNIDQRYNIFELDQLNFNPQKYLNVKKQTESVGCFVTEEMFKPEKSKHQEFLKTQNITLFTKIYNIYGKSLGFNELFSFESTSGTATGFLISPKLILTAAHVICEENSNQLDYKKIENYKFVFDYKKTDKNTFKYCVEFNKQNIYKIKKVVGHEFINLGSKTFKYILKDWALIKLDRKVIDRDPLKLNFRYMSHFAPNDKIYMLGHPSGLPMKYTGNGQVCSIFTRSIQNCNKRIDTYNTNLDAHGGNSGSPIFLEGSNEVIGILTAGPKEGYVIDQNYYNTGETFVKINHHPEEHTVMHGLTDLNFINIYLKKSALPPETSNEEMSAMGKFCPGLTNLKLKGKEWGIRIQREGLPGIVDCKSLKKLSIINCNIESKGIEYLSKQLSLLPALKILNLNDNNLEREDIEKFPESIQEISF